MITGYRRVRIQWIFYLLIATCTIVAIVDSLFRTSENETLQRLNSIRHSTESIYQLKFDSLPVFDESVPLGERLQVIAVTDERVFKSLLGRITLHYFLDVERETTATGESITKRSANERANNFRAAVMATVLKMPPEIRILTYRLDARRQVVLIIVEGKIWHINWGEGIPEYVRALTTHRGDSRQSIFQVEPGSCVFHGGYDYGVKIGDEVTFYRDGTPTATGEISDVSSDTSEAILKKGTLKIGDYAVMDGSTKN